MFGLNWVKTFVENCKKDGQGFEILLQKQVTNNLLKLLACFLLIMSQRLILKYANSWILPKPGLSFALLKRFFGGFNSMLSRIWLTYIICILKFVMICFNMVNWLDLIFINLLTFTFWTFRLFLNKVLTPPLPSYILRPMSSQCMNILYVQQQNIPNHCLFAWLIASFLALDRRGRTVSENFRFSLCESRHNGEKTNSEGNLFFFWSGAVKFRYSEKATKNWKKSPNLFGRY